MKESAREMRANSLSRLTTAKTTAGVLAQLQYSLEITQNGDRLSAHSTEDRDARSTWH